MAAAIDDDHLAGCPLSTNSVEQKRKGSSSSKAGMIIEITVSLSAAQNIIRRSDPRDWSIVGFLRLRIEMAGIEALDMGQKGP